MVLLAPRQKVLHVGRGGDHVGHSSSVIFTDKFPKKTTYEAVRTILLAQSQFEPIHQHAGLFKIDGMRFFFPPTCTFQSQPL